MITRMECFKLNFLDYYEQFKPTEANMEKLQR